MAEPEWSTPKDAARHLARNAATLANEMANLLDRLGGLPFPPGIVAQASEAVYLLHCCMRTLENKMAEVANPGARPCQRCGNSAVLQDVEIPDGFLGVTTVRKFCANCAQQQRQHERIHKIPCPAPSEAPETIREHLGPYSSESSLRFISTEKGHKILVDQTSLHVPTEPAKPAPPEPLQQSWRDRPSLL